jgi:hypothetical protein
VGGGAALTTLRLRRRRDLRALEDLRRTLARPGEAAAFDPDMAEELPAPARRYLLRAIAPGTPLARAVHLRMHGRIQLKRNTEPGRFRADQVIAEGAGYIWRARAFAGLMRISGYDRFASDEAEMRWWLYDTVPIVSENGANASRSAAGRLAGEYIFLPGALLPAHGAQWEAVDDMSAIVRLNIGLESVEMTLHVKENGALQRVSINRWNSSAINGPVGFLRFDVDEFGEEQTFSGYTIPTRFRAGWRLGSREEFAFYHAIIDSARYL